MKRSFLLIIFFLLLLVALFLGWRSKTESASLARGETRAALDIGSGATNLKVARVDPQSGKILSTIFEKSVAVPYQKELERSPNQTFNPEVMKQGITAIQELKELAQKHEAKKVVAVATAAFRKALNAPEFAAQIEKETGIKVRIIDQDEEGILGFRGALAVQPIAAQEAVIWDIGGGSMQLTTLTDQGTYLIDKGETASALFKNLVIEKIKGEDPLTVHSPNPLSQEQMEQAIQLAANLSNSTHPFIREKLSQPSTKMIAVGSLFNFSIVPIAKSNTVKQETLKQNTLAYAGKSDSQLQNDPFVDVFLTNPLMVVGYMHGLNVKSVEVVKVNNTDGALTFPAYWE